MTALALSIESPKIHRRASQKMLRLHKSALSALLTFMFVTAKVRSACEELNNSVFFAFFGLFKQS